MANLKEIRVRISSVKSTRQITSAMKMVSAAKLRKAQDAILQMRPYADKLQSIQDNLCKSLSDELPIPLREQREIEKAIFIVVTSNKGLCGGFNANIVKEVIFTIADSELYQRLMSEDKLELVCIGKKGADLLKSKGFSPGESYNELFDNLEYNSVAQLAEGLMTEFLNKNVDQVVLFYNQFKNAAVQIVSKEQLLPVASITEEDKYAEAQGDYILEPSKEEIIQELMPKLVKTTFYRSLLDSFASEHGARMTAMHQATDNATELLKDLQLDYNKARQASITNEILEIVGGAEALQG